MATTGKKKTKAPEKFKLVLGVKHLLYSSLAIVATWIWIFFLGVLVGRGDVYHWLDRWGILRARLTVPPAGLPKMPDVVQNQAEMIPIGPAKKTTAVPNAIRLPTPSAPGATPKSAGKQRPPTTHKKPTGTLAVKKFPFQNSLASPPLKSRTAKKTGKVQKAKPLRGQANVQVVSKTKSATPKTAARKRTSPDKPSSGPNPRTKVTIPRKPQNTSPPGQP